MSLALVYVCVCVCVCQREPGEDLMNLLAYHIIYIVIDKMYINKCKFMDLALLFFFFILY